MESGNHYLGALKGNQGNLFKTVQAHFVEQHRYTEITKGHGRIEKRMVSLCHQLEHITPWPGLKTLVRVERERRYKVGGHPRYETETSYYVASFIESAEAIAARIRGYWGVEKRCDPARVSRARERAPRHKVHHVRDVTQGEDASRIRMHQLPQILAVARNFSLNLYRDNKFDNMAQAQRFCQFGLDTLTQLFRMK